MNNTFKIVGVSGLAQFLGSGVFIFLMQAYTGWREGKEAWPMLMPALVLAFCLECVLLVFILRLSKGAAFFAVLASWTIGLVSYLALCGFLPSSLLAAAPLTSWLVSVGVLSLMAGKSRWIKEI